MNDCQKLWWEQTKSDHEVLLMMRRRGVEPCHQLHYLQMVTEKLGKAYFWRSNKPPPKGHAYFVRFLRALDNRPKCDRIAEVLGFKTPNSFQSWIRNTITIAYELERMAPALAGDNGPNPEYPWPHDGPMHAPASFQFAVWRDLTESSLGRQLLKVIDDAVFRFPKYG